MLRNCKLLKANTVVKKTVQYQRFVIETNQQKGRIIALSSTQNHYLRRVLRLSVGDRAVALTGKGTAWIVQLTTDEAEIVAPIEIQTELPVSVTLLVSLPKQGIDEIVRCCTEIGVTTIVPVLSERTVINPSANKLTRWRRIAQEAAEQSERAIGLLGKVLPSQLSMNDSLVIATGCEGGWTEWEVQQAKEAQFQLVSLGRRILRAVTAPITVMSLVAAFSENITEA